MKIVLISKHQHPQITVQNDVIEIWLFFLHYNSNLFTDLYNRKRASKAYRRILFL
jgi:hypothetical protein